jgi:hypothetical protein
MKESIERQELIEITKTTLKKFPDLSEYKRKKLMKAAKSAKFILVNGWRYNECGCLVGTAYFNSLSNTKYVNSIAIKKILGQEMLEIGMYFNREIINHLDGFTTYPPIEQRIIDIVD